MLCVPSTEAGADRAAEGGGRAASDRLPRRHDGPRYRPTPLLPLRRLQVPGHRVAVPEGSTQRAVAPVDQSDAAQADRNQDAGGTPGNHLPRRRLRPGESVSN